MVSIDRVKRPSAYLDGVRDTSARRRAREIARLCETPVEPQKVAHQFYAEFSTLIAPDIY